MKLYQKLAQESKIEKKSRVKVPDAPLWMFTRMVLSDQNKENFVVIAYTSGLFNGTGYVSSEAVKDFYEKICDELKNYEREKGGKFGVGTYFGVDIEYIAKDKS